MSFELPLFPLNTVVFPGGQLPLRIFEQRYLAMVTRAIADATPFGICAPAWDALAGAASAAPEQRTPAAAPAVGTLVRVVDWDMPQTGILQIATQAQQRFVIRACRSEADGLLVGDVERVGAEPAVAVPRDFELAVEILRQIVDEYDDAHFPAPHDFDNAVWVGYRLSEVLPLPLGVRQNLLEMNDAAVRLRLLVEFLKKQVN